MSIDENKSRAYFEDLFLVNWFLHFTTLVSLDEVGNLKMCHDRVRGANNFPLCMTSLRDHT